MTLTIEEPKTQPKHAKPRETFEDITQQLVESDLGTMCEVEFEEMCELAPRLAHFIVSFHECKCERRMTFAVCEPCLSDMFTTEAMYCVACHKSWSPARAAIADVVRIRS